MVVALWYVGSGQRLGASGPERMNFDWSVNGGDMAVTR